MASLPVAGMPVADNSQQRLRHLVLLLTGKFREHRQAQTTLGNVLGDWETASPVSEVGVYFLQVQRHGVVRKGLHSLLS